MNPLLEIQFRVPFHRMEASQVESAIDELLARHQTEFQNGACRIQWRFHEADFPPWLATPPTDVPGPEAVLFDAFSPARNPVMWTVDIFTGIRRHITAERPALLATYSRSTLLRVTLLEAGFHIGSGNATGTNYQSSHLIIKGETTTVSNGRSSSTGSFSNNLDIAPFLSMDPSTPILNCRYDTDGTNTAALMNIFANYPTYNGSFGNYYIKKVNYSGDFGSGAVTFNGNSL